MREYPLESFIFYRSFRDAIEEMSDEDKLATLLAITDYALYGVEPKLKGVMPRAVFTVVRPSIDTNMAKREGGKKGGRPPKEPMVNTSKNHRFSKSKNTDTVTVTDTVTDTDTDTPAGSTPSPPSENFGPELQSVFSDWLAYKQEKRQGYKPIGLKSLVTQVRKNAEQYGEAAVIDLMRLCMSNGWQGIIWEKLKDTKQHERVRTDAEYEGGDDFFAQ